jgi:hypothetical protein
MNLVKKACKNRLKDTSLGDIAPSELGDICQDVALLVWQELAKLVPISGVQRSDYTACSSCGAQAGASCVTGGCWIPAIQIRT